MTTLQIAKLLPILALLVLPAAGAHAQEAESCDVPSYFVASDAQLKRVEAVVKKTKHLEIAVLGTGSSALGGAEGAAKAYPARLQAALERRLPSVTVNVVSQAKIRQTTADMAKTMDKLLVDAKPTLVLWQTGTVDAMRGIDPEDFRSTLDDGVETLQTGNADVVLINMQYSPRTESMIQLGAYADNMRVVARDRDVPLFDRLGLMRYWNDSGTFDLYAAAKDNALASKVHDCLGRALAALVIEAAHLEKFEGKAVQ
jgi:lysophospholipase L1-like esterase